VTSIWTGAYWRATAERVISTAAQAGIAYAVSAGTLDVLHFDWTAFAGIAGGGALLSLLKGLAANAVTQDGPGFTKAEQVIPLLTPEPGELGRTPDARA
jgi:hypothetical protein